MRSIRWFSGVMALLVMLAGCGQAAVAPPAATTAPAVASQSPSATTSATATVPAATPTIAATGTSIAATETETTQANVIEFNQPPEWARGATIYQIFVRAFTPEGTIAAATARLPEIRDLGVDVVYLLPIHPIGAERRKGSLGSPYSVRDYRAIDPALGTAADFRAFVEKAHSLDLRVMLDLVANHSAWDNPLITEHPDWYVRNAAGEILPPNADWTDVAELDYANADLRRYMIETSLYWVNEFGIDGFRADAAEQVPTEFWRDWRDALKAANPELLLLSESAGLSMYRSGFEVAYDWDTQAAFTTALLNPGLTQQALSTVVAEQRRYSNQLWRMRYLENHDQERIASVTATKVQRRAAAAFLLTIPGLPLIYAGQEVGATERPSLFEPDTVNFARGDENLRAIYAELIKLRGEHPALREGTLTPLSTKGQQFLLFERATAEQRVLVFINMQSKPEYAEFGDLTEGRNLQSGETVDLRRGLSVEGYGYRLIEVP